MPPHQPAASRPGQIAGEADRCSGADRGEYRLKCFPTLWVGGCEPGEPLDERLLRTCPRSADVQCAPRGSRAARGRRPAGSPRHRGRALPARAGADRRRILTTTSVPSVSVAACAWPIEALASGSASKLPKTSSGRCPNSSMITASTASGATGGAPSWSFANSRWYSGGSTSGLVDKTCPSLMKVAPSSSSANRRCSGRVYGRSRCS